uniref:alpha-N-acetylgalactosaminide alpha-2,6-sialyltransferase n=1 Tax=Anolis carolinensis TaxID=28377 RepID=G1KHS4_ANOCA|nr:PREDICTED: alpha-N-acetylgalactosaminide alpha-2,6-sialyltransferase 2 [Anolis carolinensis]|eukprot:XP_008102573.1 PREDICTED: alpha-N-acetylgalactosaminide alpha-2,6-sialyltransferase 2 [Anolis carolinensis]
MGSPRWKRLCLLVLLGLAFSVLFYGHYYGAESPTSPRLPQQETLQLPQAELPQDARSHHLVGERVNQTKDSSKEESPHHHKEKSSLCPWSLKSKVKNDPTFGKQFDFDGPVLMWNRHFTPETWKKLKERSVPYGWRGLPHSVISSTLQLLSNAANIRLLNETTSPDGCVRCAVVGNGGILNGSHQGKEIDAHDFVFRLNGAVIKGFEADVGTKISFYGFTVNTMKNSLIAYAEYGFTQIPQAKDIRYIFIPSDKRDYLMLKSAILGIPVPEGYDKGDKPQKYFGSNTSAEKFKLLHPEFMYYLTERFLKSEIINSQFGHLYMPSTGAIMLLTALHTCDQLSAFGFITDSYRTFSDHYYDHEKKPLVFYTNHDMLLEPELWKSLHRAGIMKLYQR